MRHAALALLLAACAPACPEPRSPVQAEAPAAFVLQAEEIRMLWAPSGKARIEIYARGANAFIGRLSLDPGASVPEHRDATEEYIHVLKGYGKLTIDGDVHDVGPGDTVFMPAGASVSYENGDEEMVAIQVFAGPGPADRYEAWFEEKPGG